MQLEAPYRVSRSYTQTLCRPPDEVFPLLCPVRETEWVNGWQPKLVITSSGFAERDCIFVTPGTPQDALWLMTACDPANRHLEILKLIPELAVGRITIDLSADDSGGSAAHIRYSYTALGAFGRKALDEFTAEHFARFMRTWERELNHFLQTGRRLDPDQDDN